MNTFFLPLYRVLKYSISLYCILFVVLVSAQKIDGASNILQREDTLSAYYSHAISKNRLIEMVSVLSSDTLQGRNTGTFGQKMAADYIYSIYKTAYFQHVLQTSNFFQKFNCDNLATENIIALIPGMVYPKEFIVISAHYDHIGMENVNKIYYGADDNASGSAAIIEILRTFIVAARRGDYPKRTLVFVHFSGEELGLKGSEYFVNSKILPMDSVKVNINLDMIGRVDNNHTKNPHYLYSVGSDYFSNLDSVMHVVNNRSQTLEIDYEYNSTQHKEVMFKRNDSFNFAKKGVPFVLFTSGLHKDYHTTTDTADKIDYDVLHLRTKFIFNFIWELANQDPSISINQKKLKNFLNSHSSNIDYMPNFRSPGLERKKMQYK